MKSELHYEIGDEIKTVTVERDGNRWQVTVGDKVYLVAARQVEPGQFELELNKRRMHAIVAQIDLRRYVAISGKTWILERTQPRQHKRPRGPGMSGHGSLEATMPGLVREVLVSAGDPVERGDPLVLLEAMKMELRVSAPYAGQVRKVHCQAGQVVERGQTLVEIEERDKGTEPD
jgi:3-methylcrotonyl-CoA carboxylase alpha subunit